MGEEIYFVALILAAIIGYVLENRRDDRLHEELRDMRLVAQDLLQRVTVLEQVSDVEE